MTAPLTAMRRLPVLVLVLVLVLSGLLLWRTLRDGRPAAGIGTVVAAADPITGGERVTVRVPTRAYDVRAVVRDDVPDDLAVRRQQAPDDGSFVGVSIARADGPDTILPSFGRSASVPTEPTYVLVADGRRYRLTAGSDDDQPTGAPLAVYVAVAGEARSLQLEVTWAGRSQSVDLRTGSRKAGDFAPLYRGGSDTAALRSCGALGWPSGYRADVGQAAGCRYAAYRLPYAPGRGWARAGQQWLALRVVTSRPAGFVHRVGARDVRYSTRFGMSDDSRRHRLDGAAPLERGRLDIFAVDTRSDLLLFSVPVGGAAHTATFVQSVQGYGRTVDSVVTVSPTWTVRV